MVIHRDAIDFYPPPFPRDSQSNFRQWVESHQDEYNKYDVELENVAESHRITEADGENLDRIGAMFGPLGKRRNRGDYEYRQYLMSLSNAFAGRGTNYGIRFAVKSGVFADDLGDIVVQEDTSNLTYTLLIEDWEPHSTSVVDDLSQLADPSVVERVPPIKYTEETGTVNYSAGDIGQGRSVTLPPARTVYRGHSLENRLVNDDGFGAGNFDGTDDFGPSGGDTPEDGYGFGYGYKYGE